MLVMEPRRRHLQRDVFMHCSFFGKLKDRREKSQLIMMLKSSQAPISNTKVHNLLEVLCLYAHITSNTQNKEMGVPT